MREKRWQVLSSVCCAKAASERAQNDAAILQLPLLLNTWLTYHVLISCHWMPSLFVRFQLLLLLLLPPCLHAQHSAIEDVLNPVNPCLFIWLHKSPVYVYICTSRHSVCMFSQQQGQGALLLLVRDTGLFANFHWVATDKEASVKMASLRRYTDQSRRHSNVTMATKIIVVANQKASAWLWS